MCLLSARLETKVQLKPEDLFDWDLCVINANIETEAQFS